MKNKLQAKLNSYSVLAGALFTVTNLNSQIQYTDIDPDIDISQLGDSIYFLDMNNDGLSDFSLFSFYYNKSGSGSFTQNYMMIELKNNSNAFIEKDALAKTFYGWYHNVEVAGMMESGDTIDQNKNWQSVIGSPNFNLGGWFYNKHTAGTTAYYSSHYIFGWSNTTDKYLGLKFVDNAQTYYGWVRLDVETLYERMVIKDYAYNAVAGSMILAGDTGQGVAVQTFEKNQLEDNFTAYSLNNCVNIILKEEYKEKTICIYDFSGKRIHVSSIHENSARIPLLHSGNSILIVEVITEKGILRKKIHFK